MQQTAIASQEQKEAASSRKASAALAESATAVEYRSSDSIASGGVATGVPKVESCVQQDIANEDDDRKSHVHKYGNAPPV
jgi:hypothetical protein